MTHFRFQLVIIRPLPHKYSVFDRRNDLSPALLRGNLTPPQRLGAGLSVAVKFTVSVLVTLRYIYSLDFKIPSSPYIEFRLQTISKYVHQTRVVIDSKTNIHLICCLHHHILEL